MNIIGLVVPKIITLLTIWIPNYDTKAKGLLTIIWLIKFVLDYDLARPGHSGRVYKLTKNIDFEIGEVVISLIRFILPIAYEIVAILFDALIPSILGGIYIVIVLVDLVCNIREMIQCKKKRMR